MDNRHKDYIRGRRSVLDKEQVSEANTDRDDRSPVKPRHTTKRLIPLLAFALIGLLIARDKIPAVNSAWERLVNADAWLAGQACQKAAIGSSERREYARILKPGRVNETTDGWYVERLVIGEMGPSGNEVSIEYSCYLDGNAELVTLSRNQKAIFQKKTVIDVR